MPREYITFLCAAVAGGRVLVFTKGFLRSPVKSQRQCEPVYFENGAG